MRASKPMPYEKKKKLVGLCFVLPWLIGCVYFLLIPLLKSLYYSFGNVKVVLGGLEWTSVGWNNYVKLFVQDEEALPNLVSTLGNMLYQLPVIIVFSLMIAMVLNRKFRGVDRPTDVLSFPLYEDGNFDMTECIGGAVLGDVVISLERAAEQAAELGHSTVREVAFLTVHSVLHLLGYDHERSSEEEEKQCAKQREIMKKLTEE